MKIAHIATSYFPRMGGIPQSIRDYCQHITEHEHHLFVRDLYAYQEGPRFDTKRAAVGTFKEGDYLTIHRFPQPLPDKLPFGNSVIISNEMMKALKEFDFDVLITHSATPDLLYPPFVVKQPWIMNSRWYTKLQPKIIERTSKIQTYSDLYTSAYLSDGIPMEKLVTIPLCVDIDLFKPDHENKDPNRLLYVGRIAPEKRLPELLAIFRGLVDNIPELQLRIVGRADHSIYLLDLEEAIEEYHLKDNVEMVGYKHGEELVKEFQEAMILVLPTVKESFSQVMLQGLACGLPCIAFDCPGLRWSQKVAALVHDWQEFETIIYQALSMTNPEGRKFVEENYSWKRWKPAYLEVLKCVNAQRN